MQSWCLSQASETMHSLELMGMTDLKEEFMSKVQNVESEKFKEYCCSINESATESAKTVSNGMKTIITKFLSNVFEEDIDGGRNPLGIDLVIRTVLSFLSPKDLCSCRQVCRFWNQEARVFFRQKQRVVFYPESVKKMETFIRFVSQEEDEILETDQGSSSDTYHDSNWRKNAIPTFTSYCFTAQYQSTQFSRTLMHDFSIICGQYVKKLEIFYPDDGSLSAQDFMAFFIVGMTNLESIHFVNLPQKLTSSSFLSEDNSYHVRELNFVTQLRIDRTWQIETCWSERFLKDLLGLMPNLKDYELWTWNSTTEDDHSKPYFVSLSPTQRETLRILRPGSIGDELGLTISELGLKLNKLYLPVLDRDVSAKTIELLLQDQRNTLEEFQVNCSTMQDSRLIVFPKMNKLRHLHMIITYPWNNDYTVFTPPINYEGQFPRIKVLKLELAIYSDFGFISYFFPRKTNYPTVSLSLVELDISFSGFRDEKFIETVAEIFPNLSRLRLDGYGSKIFSSICLHLQNLEHLELYLIYGFNVDDQITGIPKEICVKLRKQCAAQVVDSVKIDDPIQVYPSLRSLTRLRKLAIRQKDYQAKFWPDAQCITNLSAYFALAHMKHLRNLRIESVKFSEECRGFLAAALEDCWLDFT